MFVGIALGATGLYGLFYLLQLQIAFVNVGQEFGAYGQYNRVLHLIQSMPEFEIVGHSVNRELTWDHILHVEHFSIRVRDGSGQIVDILFEKGTSEMGLKDIEKLRGIVREKHDKAVQKQKRKA